MANADCKMMSLAFFWRVELAARESVSRAQACLKGRSMTDQIRVAEVWGIQQFMLGRGLSCPSLADVAAAFPSIAISRLLRVLAAMQIHLGAVGFFEALYS